MAGGVDGVPLPLAVLPAVLLAVVELVDVADVFWVPDAVVTGSRASAMTLAVTSDSCTTGDGVAVAVGDGEAGAVVDC